MPPTIPPGSHPAKGWLKKNSTACGGRQNQRNRAQRDQRPEVDGDATTRNPNFLNL
jgi:hypothetical protein